jgi:hypothetical protein
MASQQNINDLKENIEKHRLESARIYLVSGSGAKFESDQEEEHLISLINAEKVCFYHCMELQLQYPPVWLTHHFTYFKYLFHQP